ncbi:DEAD/DEAH box helicase [Nocardia sp. BMG51109]|uniref:Lhr family ATP-dependent helicase n=1 Tax=Nocardia sp. BMG51109 TaxID=1056816 RepID=UPI0004B04A24|nr:DEAD/DEAH box helicase [Nocardia sp. BMG51109]
MDQFSRPTQEWFDGAFPAPTAAQQGAWKAISAGEHTLVIAPTGSGKTLSAFLWAIDRLATREPADGPRKTSVLYVSPLKALAVDVERNLRSPLVGVTQTAKRLGLSPPEITVGVRSGDTGAAARRSLQRTPPDILITTPESLYLMLTSAARETLSEVHTVIVDEVHAIAGSKRGAHLSLSLARLDRLTERPAQRIGLSATVRPPKEVGRFLAGPAPITIVSPPAPKTFDLSVRVPVADMTEPDESGESDRPGSIWPHVDAAIVDLVLAHRSSIVFANSRRLAERLTARLNESYAESLGETVDLEHEVPAEMGTPSDVTHGGSALLARAHHGSVSKEQRALIEDDLKSGRLRCVVATSSLELGIDMGAVDLVVQVEAPPSVASGLQRVGRAGHQVGEISRGVIFPKHRTDVIHCAVASTRMAAGQIEELKIPAHPLDVLAQQTVAACALEPLDADAWFETVRGTGSYAALPRSAYESVLDLLSGRYPSDEFAELRPRVVWDRDAGTVTGRPGAQRLAVTSGGAIPDRGLFPVFMVGEKASRVGELDEEMVYESRVGDVFALGATSWRIEEITHDRVLVTPAFGLPGRLPFWHGDSLGRPAELGAALGEFVRTAGRAVERAPAAQLDTLIRAAADPHTAFGPNHTVEQGMTAAGPGQRGETGVDPGQGVTTEAVSDRPRGDQHGDEQDTPETASAQRPRTSGNAGRNVESDQRKGSIRDTEAGTAPDFEEPNKYGAGEHISAGSAPGRERDDAQGHPPGGRRRRDEPRAAEQSNGSAPGASARAAAAARPATRGQRRAPGAKSAGSDLAELEQVVHAAGLDDFATANLVSLLADQRQATGHLPTDRTLLVERFRDELGDWRLILHSPYGLPVHAPWALAVGSRLRERFGVDAAPTASDDGIVVRLPDTTDDPPGAELFVFEPDEIDELVTEQVGSSALFASRFRECAARALLLPRRDPGRRAPLWQQRQRAAQLLDVARKFPDFPILLETVRECLQDVYDLAALRDLLSSVARRKLRLVEVETAAPSPFANALLFDYIGQFIYEGDSPLAERRAAALSLDSSLLGELLGRVELRELLDADVLEQTERELQRLTPERLARDAEGLADLLRLLGPLTAAEAARRCDGDPRPWFEELSSARRALEVSFAGETWWTAVEDASRLRDALGVPLPIGTPAAFVEPVADPLGDLVGRYARTHGPFGLDAVAHRFGIGTAVAATALHRLAHEKRVVEGEFTPGAAGAEWCDSQVLRRLRRRSLAAARKEVEPVATAAFARFLPPWQHVGTGDLRGVDGVAAVVEQLAGVPIPASAWESLILPSRVRDYSPAMLDELMATGEVVWSGHGPITAKDGWVALHPADQAALTLPPPDDIDFTETQIQLLLALGATVIPESTASQSQATEPGRFRQAAGPANSPDQRTDSSGENVAAQHDSVPQRDRPDIGRADRPGGTTETPAPPTGNRRPTETGAGATGRDRPDPGRSGKPDTTTPSGDSGDTSPAPGRHASHRRDADRRDTDATTTSGDAAGRVHVLPGTGGAYFFRQLSDATGLLDDAAVAAALWELVWAGHVTGDTFAPVRALLSGTTRSSTAHRTPRRTPRGRMYLPRANMPSRTGPPTVAGRWSLLPERVSDNTIRAHATADLLLERYGVLTRGAVQGEGVPGGFALMYRVLTEFEDRGRCRRGYFVDSLGGAQFSTTDVVDRLRTFDTDRTERTSGGALALAACDPANPYGATLPWPKGPEGGGHRPGRKAGALVVLADGDLALYLERGGKTLLTFTEDPQVRARAATALADLVHHRRVDSLVIDRVDGDSVHGNTFATFLTEAGFAATPRGFRLRSKP